MSQFTRSQAAKIDSALLDLIESSPRGLRVPSDRRRIRTLADCIYCGLPLVSGEISQSCRKFLGIEHTEFAVLHALKDILIDFETERKRVRALRRSLRRGLWRRQLIFSQCVGLRRDMPHCHIRSVWQHERIAYSL